MEMIDRASLAITHFVYFLKMVNKTHPVVASELVRLPVKYLILPFEKKLGAELLTPRLLLSAAFKEHFQTALEQEEAATPSDSMLFGGAFTTMMERLMFELEYMGEYQKHKGGYLTAQATVSHLGATLMTLTNHEQLLKGLGSIHDNAGIGDIPAYIVAAYYDYYSDDHWFGPGSEAWHDTSGIYDEQAS